MKLFKRIVYTLLGLIMTLTIAMIGLIVYSEYSGKQFFAKTSGNEYADLTTPEDSRLISEDGNTAASGTSDSQNTEAPGQNEAANPLETTTPEAVSDTAAGSDAADTPVADEAAAVPPSQPDAAAQAPIDTSASTGSPKVYVLNTESALFHYSDCELVSKINPEYYATMTADRSAVAARGYDPCTVCNP